MGFFSKLNDFAVNQAIKTIEDFRHRKADVNSLQMAFQTLCSCGKLFKRDDVYGNEIESFYWIRSTYMVNISNDCDSIRKTTENAIIGEEHSYRKAKSSECTTIDLSNWY